MKISYLGIIIFTLFSFITNTSFGQANIVSQREYNSLEKQFVTRNSSPISSNENLQKTRQNTVFIQQIGQSNKVYTNAQTSKGSISVLQDGDNNKAGLFLKAETIEYNLTQSGNDNKYLHFNKSNPDLIKVNAVQQGNDTDIIIHGKNSISEKMKINMIGNDRALIIRNFN